MQWSMKIDSLLTKKQNKKETRNYLLWRKKTIRKEIENYLLYAVESYEWIRDFENWSTINYYYLKLLISAQRYTKTCDKLKDKVVFVQYNYPLIKWIRSPKKIN